MKRVMYLALCGALLPGACADGPVTGPEDGNSGLAYTLGGSRHAMQGSLSVDPSQALLQPFVAARADSVGGFVVVGYETASPGKGNLLVLQGRRQTGLQQCAAAGDPCHGRLITGIVASNTAQFDRFFSIVSGAITVTQIGPDRLRATFSATLQADDAGPDATIVVQDGTIDVPYVADPETDGSLQCLLSRVGIGNGTCRS